MSGRWRVERALGGKGIPEGWNNICKGTDLVREDQESRKVNALEATSGWGRRSGQSQIRQATECWAGLSSCS